MFARFGWAVRDRFLGRGDEARPYDAVKLVHAADLRTWDRFPRCQEFDGITYGQYRAEAYRLERRRRTVADLIKASDTLHELDTEQVVEYGTETVDVPRALVPRTVRLALPEPPRPGTWVESSAGRIRDGALELEARPRRRSVDLTYRGASRLVNAERIAELKRVLGAMSDEQRRTIDEVTASRYAHPVLFVSHRWGDEAHPDPSGSQLRKLQALEDCFIVYDYSSFPQPPRTEQEEAAFTQILASMDGLIRNVVVLGAPDYLTRGWCVYEYIVASLRESTVCDEVHDERFVKLRDWASTPPPASMSFRDSFESQQQNYINERILATVNEVLPVYRESDFRDEHDTSLVNGLLIEHLKRTLPAIKESQQHLGEWSTTQWTDESLAPFFRGEAEVPQLQSGVAIRRFRTSVPSTLDERGEPPLRDQALSVAAAPEPAGRPDPLVLAPRMTPLGRRRRGRAA